MKFNSYFLRRSATVFRLLIILGITSSLSGCDPTGDQIEAIEQPDVDDFSVLLSDTTTVGLSTVISDSVMTGAPSRLLVGGYNDAYFGRFQSAAYFQPTIDNAIAFPELAVYDSLTLSLRYDNYTYGDTTVAMNLSVHQLQADLLDRNVYYNDYTTPYDASPLGKVKVVPTPRSSKTLKIKLSDKLGQQIFQMGKTNLLTSNTEWINLVKGLAIIPGANDNGSVIGFSLIDDLTSVQLHYHLTGEDGIRRDSTVIRSNIAYNQILANRAGTQLAKLPTTRRIALPSTQSGNMSFIQAGLGLMTRVDFPTLLDLKANPYTVVNRAYLRVTPLKSSVTNFLPPPPVLYAYLVDRNNEFFQGSNGFPAPLTDLSGRLEITGSYTVDYVNNISYYAFDLSGYITSILASGADNSTGIVFRTSPFDLRGSAAYPAANTEFTKSASRLVIGNQQNSDPGVKLDLYYTSVRVK